MKVRFIMYICSLPDAEVLSKVCSLIKRRGDFLKTKFMVVKFLLVR